jgi:hypothetical protein
MVLITLAMSADNPERVRSRESYSHLFELLGLLLCSDLTIEHVPKNLRHTD